MTVGEIKAQFYSSLSELFPSEEIQSFFSLLAEQYLNYNRFETVVNADVSLSEEQEKQFKTALEKLRNHRPIQYILGATEFYGLPFKVTPATLIPRPETEELVQWILDDAAVHGAESSEMHYLDIGTGSGCIAITLAKHLPKIEMTALDISEETLKVAQQNALLNDVVVDFQQKDILKTGQLEKTFDCIISNPPYVRNIEKQQMAPNVLHFEPDAALYVEDDDPLVFYRKIARLAKHHLKPHGRLYFEINEYLSKETMRLLTSDGFTAIELRQDMFGKDRMICCQLRTNSHE